MPSPESSPHQPEAGFTPAVDVRELLAQLPSSQEAEREVLDVADVMAAAEKLGDTSRPEYPVQPDQVRALLAEADGNEVVEAVVLAQLMAGYTHPELAGEKADIQDPQTSEFVDGKLEELLARHSGPDREKDREFELSTVTHATALLLERAAESGKLAEPLQALLGETDNPVARAVILTMGLRYATSEAGEAQVPREETARVKALLQDLTETK